MKKYLFPTLLCVLVAVAAFFIGRISAQIQFDKQLDDIVNIYAAEISETEQKCYDGLVLSADKLDITDVYGKQADLSAIAGPKNICARFSATGCRPCIDTLTDALLQFAEANPDWHINLLIDNILQRDLYVLSKEFGPSFTLYATGPAMIGTGSEESPAMFRLTTDGTIFRHFTCSPDYPDRTRAYTATIPL